MLPSNRRENSEEAYDQRTDRAANMRNAAPEAYIPKRQESFRKLLKPVPCDRGIGMSRSNVNKEVVYEL